MTNTNKPEPLDLDSFEGRLKTTFKEWLKAEDFYKSCEPEEMPYSERYSDAIYLRIFWTKAMRNLAKEIISAPPLSQELRQARKEIAELRNALSTMLGEFAPVSQNLVAVNARLALKANPMTKPVMDGEGLSDNMLLVLKNHPELASEYIDKGSKYYDTPNGKAYRRATPDEIKAGKALTEGEG